MNTTLRLLLMATLVMTFSVPVFASSHETKGSAGSGYETGSKAMLPSIKKFGKAVDDYLSQQAAADGTISIVDHQAKKRKLEFDHLHTKVHAKNDSYYVCADFKDVNSGEMVDVDIYAQHKGGRVDGHGC